MRALVVTGGAAAACAFAWLTATASASTVTDIADGPLGKGSPAVEITTDDPQPPVLVQVADSAPAVQGARDAAARLVDRLETNVPYAVDALPATVAAVGRIAVAATELASAPTDGVRDDAEKPAAGLDTPAPDDASRAPVNSLPRERSADISSAMLPLRVVAAEVAGQLPADDRADHGADDLGGRSWPPSWTVSANAGPASGHDRGCGDVAQPDAGEHPQQWYRKTGVQHRAVTAAEIQPGVTPD
ncbi:hypothetical protein [Amycolatopsis sp. lyj-346]|uniref:hypothetical protein n=1 Tax=Amycolatopsis sp. lyj-346 TaxID=2789289 RepID=UPI003978DDCD